MSVQQNLTKRLQKIRRGLEGKEKYMFRTLSDLIRKSQDETIEIIGGILMKKKYKKPFENVQDNIEIRRTAREITKDRGMDRIYTLLNDVKRKVYIYVQSENKRIYKDDYRDIEMAINETTPFRAKATITEKDLQNIMGIYVAGFPLKYYMDMAFAEITMKITKILRRNIALKGQNASISILRELKNAFVNLVQYLQMVLYQFNTAASNIAFYEALSAFKSIKVIK